LDFGRHHYCLGLVFLWLFSINVPADEVSTYRFTGGGDPIQLPELELPTATTNLILSLLLIGVGVLHAVRGIKNSGACFSGLFRCWRCQFF
jgi:hypothetical protein